MDEFEIKVFDNVFNKELTKKIWDSVSRPKWQLSGGSKQREERFWHMEDLDKEEFYEKYLFQILCDKYLIEKTSAYKIHKIYANGQTANQNGTAHCDDSRPNTFTLLYYPNLEWHYSWNGSLFFLNHLGSHPEPNTEIIKTVSYKPNRAIYFPSNICHYAEAPSLKFNDIRVSIAWKLTKYFEIKL